MLYFHFLSVLLLLVGQAAGFWPFSTDNSATSKSLVTVNKQYESGYSALADTRLADVFKNATSALQSLVSSEGACSKVAVLGLLDRCDQLKVSDREFDIDIENIRTQFAALLALCEMKYDDNNWPTECVAVTNIGRASKSELHKCFRWIQADGQRWTSYSNNRERSHIVCEASQRLMETERMIRVQAETLMTTGNVGAALKDLITDYELRLRGAMEFGEQVIQIKQDALSELSELDQQTKSWFKELVKNLKENLAYPLHDIISNLEKAGGSINVVNQELEKTDQLSLRLRRNIIENHDEYSKAQEENFLGTRKTVNEIQSALYSLSAEAGSEIVGLIRYVTEQTAVIQTKHALLSDDMDDLYQKLLEAQDAQSSVSAGLENMKSLLLDITGRLNTLHNIVNIFRDFVSFAWELRVFGSWLAVVSFIVAVLTFRLQKLQTLRALLIIGALWFALQTGGILLEDLGWATQADHIGEGNNLGHNFGWFLVPLLMLGGTILLKGPAILNIFGSRCETRVSLRTKRKQKPNNIISSAKGAAPRPEMSESFGEGKDIFLPLPNIKFANRASSTATFGTDRSARATSAPPSPPAVEYRPVRSNI